jgi:hypothetical protein
LVTENRRRKLLPSLSLSAGRPVLVGEGESLGKNFIIIYYYLVYVFISWRVSKPTSADPLKAVGRIRPFISSVKRIV